MRRSQRGRSRQAKSLQPKRPRTRKLQVRSPRQKQQMSLHRKGQAVEKRKAIRPQPRANRKHQHYKI